MRKVMCSVVAIGLVVGVTVATVFYQQRQFMIKTLAKYPQECARIFDSGRVLGVPRAVISERMYQEILKTKSAQGASVFHKMVIKIRVHEFMDLCEKG